MVLRSRKTKTIRMPPEKKTPKTGYHSKKKSETDASRGIGSHYAHRQKKARAIALFR
jgi:hypothetical protein